MIALAMSLVGCQWLRDRIEGLPKPPRPTATATAPTPEPTPTDCPVPCQFGPGECDAPGPCPTDPPPPTATPTAPTPAPTAEPRPTDDTCVGPPPMLGINGGGGCRYPKFKADGTVICELDFTQWFNPIGADGTKCKPGVGATSCDRDHYTDPLGNITMGPCCCWRDWDESRPVCQKADTSEACGFRVSVTGANWLGPKPANPTHSAVIQGPQGGRVEIRVCPDKDGAYTKDGWRVPVQGNGAFPGGCGSVKRWMLPTRTP